MDMKERDKTKLQASEMKFLRDIAIYRRTDNKWNDEIRKLNDTVVNYKNIQISHT
jgi:hypothetical protein